MLRVFLLQENSCTNMGKFAYHLCTPVLLLHRSKTNRHNKPMRKSAALQNISNSKGFCNYEKCLKKEFYFLRKKTKMDLLSITSKKYFIKHVACMKHHIK